MHKLRVGISGSYGGLNLGDEAILESIIMQLREHYAAEITVFSRDTSHTLMNHQVDRSVAVREITRREAREIVGNLDVFILGGGGILFDKEADLFLREVFLAHECGVPVVVYAVSAGPLKNPTSRELVGRALKDAALITVRDRQGRKLLEDIGVEQEIHLTADPAFLLPARPVSDEQLQREGLESGRRLIGFSVREPGPAAPDINVQHYHGLLANAADFMVDRLDADVVFVPMERRKMDVQHSHAVVSAMQNAHRATVLRGEWSPGQVLTLMKQFEFAVGMRLHFLLFAARQSVPFVALPYSSKVSGLIQDLDMQMPVLNDVNPGRLLAIIDRTWDLRNSIKNQIAARVPDLQQRARRTHELMSGLSALRAAA